MRWFSARGPEQPPGLQVRFVRRAAQRDGLHRAQGDQPAVLAVQDPPVSQAPALPAVRAEVPHHPVDGASSKPKPDEMETFRPPGLRAGGLG